MNLLFKPPFIRRNKSAGNKYAHFISLCFILNLLWTNANAQFARGADVSWLSQMESSGKKFYDNSGNEQDLFDILTSKGINSIRFRVWVNPANGWCGKADIVKQAIRAKNKGFRIMIDFHYSDSWADPGKQTIPAAWASYNLSQLVQAVYDHTHSVLDSLKQNNVTPTWVQVGNETSDGMLWEYGRASKNMKNFADMITSGYNAVKDVCPDSTKVIVHIANGYDNSLFRWIFDGLKTYSAKYDVIGMSLYPEADTWQTLNSQCLSNMQDMVSRYGKEVIISEVGMGVTEPADCKSFIKDMISKNKSLSSAKGLGVFYWEPECYNGWQGYNKGAFDNSGKPTIAMGAFLEDVVSGIEKENNRLEAGKTGYPNPFHNSFTLDIDGLFEYTIYNSTGIALENGKGKNHSSIGTGLSPGVYTVKIRNSSGDKFIKIIKN